MSKCWAHRVSWIAAVSLFLLVAAATSPLCGQSSTRDRVRQHSLDVRQRMNEQSKQNRINRWKAEKRRAEQERERKIREQQRERERAEQKAAWEKRRKEFGQSAEQRKETREALKQFEYQLERGETIAYVMAAELKSASGSEYLGGVIVFQVVEADSHKMTVRAADNVIQASDARALPLALPREPRLATAEFQVDHRNGLQPVSDGSLPWHLGNLESWFFPPLPTVQGRSESQEYYVVKPPGQPFRLWGRNSPENFEPNRFGKFSWSVTNRGVVGPLTQMSHQQDFHRQDRQVALLGSSQMQFDLRRGLVAQREFKGSYADTNTTAELKLTIRLLSNEQLVKLPR